MRFGDRLWIRPSGREVTQPDAVIVDLDPGLAFGTGTHPTTALCLEWLDRHAPVGKTVLDFGCGSGVLGVAALKLGAQRVIGVDHDPQALLASRENARRNAVAERLEVVHSDVFDGAPADVVIANILANVLVDLAPTISSLVEPGGQLVLSGILADQADDVVQAYAGSVKFAPRIERDGWVLLHGMAQ
jgi:ribosomal protein L11 methyltransferase